MLVHVLEGLLVGVGALGRLTQQEAARLPRFGKVALRRTTAMVRMRRTVMMVAVMMMAAMMMALMMMVMDDVWCVRVGGRWGGRVALRPSESSRRFQLGLSSRAGQRAYQRFQPG